VYVIWGGAETPLYVGMSVNPMARVGRHAASAEWWADAELVEVFLYESEPAARSAEAWTIAALSPVNNVHRPTLPAEEAPEPVGDLIEWPVIPRGRPIERKPRRYRRRKGLRRTSHLPN